MNSGFLAEKVTDMNAMREIQQPTETILKRIDTIIQELQELRQAVLAQERSLPGNLTAQLYGALGQGDWDEYDLASNDTDFDRVPLVRRYTF